MIFWISIIIIFILSFLWSLISLKFSLNKKQVKNSQGKESLDLNKKPKEFILFEDVRLTKKKN